LDLFPQMLRKKVQGFRVPRLPGVCLARDPARLPQWGEVARTVSMVSASAADLSGR
jgi:hypothetical protein